MRTLIMTSNLILVVAATALLLTCCGSDGGDVKPTGDDKPAAPREVVEKVKPSPAALGGDKVPAQLEGQWERIEQPMMGMQIEFALFEGRVVAHVTRPPAAGDAAAAYYAEKNKNLPDKGKELATCLASLWQPGVHMFVEVDPKGENVWSARQQKKFFKWEPCTEARVGYPEVEIRLVDQQTIETVPVNENPKMPSPKEIWKKVGAPEAEAKE